MEVAVVIQLVGLGDVKRGLGLRSTGEPPGFRVAGGGFERGRFVLATWD
jgi:hypothetical protein